MKRSNLSFLYQIGGCGKCMRQSFVAMCMSWAFVVPTIGLGILFNIEPWVMKGLAALAGFLTALWALHILVFATRQTLKSRSGYKGILPSAHSAGSLDLTVPKTDLAVARRQFFPVLAASVGAAVVVTAMPRSSLAQTYCGGRSGRDYGSCPNGICCGFNDGRGGRIYQCCTNGCNYGGGFCN